jgi:flavin reductase
MIGKAPHREHWPTPPFETLPSVERGSFLSAMGRVFSTVTIVATDGPAGRCAVTVSAANSASADPPLVFACINRRSPLNTAIHANGVFCINVLAFGQEQLSDSFAGRPRAGVPFDFAHAQWRTAKTGCPILVGAVAAFDCVVHSSHGAGTHTVFFGRVLDTFEEETVPLIYGQRCYGRPTTHADQLISRCEVGSGIP